MKYISSNGQYFLAHGLTRDPFPDVITENNYFITTELGQRLELIRHLLECSHKLLLVTAPAKTGKSSLYRYITVQAAGNWQTTCLIADTGMEAGILLREIIKGIQEGDTVNQSSKPVTDVITYLEYCNRNNVLPVVLIDDADKLPAETLGFILEITKLQHDGTRLRFVLIGDRTLAENLESVFNDVPESDILHSITIPLLSLEQTSAYINYRLSLCGGITDTPFTEKSIRCLHKVAGGIPGEINLLARQILQDPAIFRTGNNIVLSGFCDGFPASINKPLLTGFILVSVIAGYFIFHGVHDQAIGVAGEQQFSVESGRPEKDPASVNDSAWLQQQAPQRYVLQLIGAHDRETIEKFLDLQPSINSNMAIFTTFNAGKPWYVVVYGLYPNRDSAVADIVRLPQFIQSQSPWPRTISSIINELEK